MSLDLHSIRRSLALGVLTTLLMSVIGCAPPSSSPSPTAIPTAPSPAEQSPLPDNSTSREALEFNAADESLLFSLQMMPDGAKLVDGTGAELARFTVDERQKIKIKDASDRPLGYVVTHSDHWKLENADQTQELYILRRQSDGDYKLEDGADQSLYRIKEREYGFEIETPEKQSLYKVKRKDDTLVLRNAAEETVLVSRSSIAPIAIACFGLDALTPTQQAALAYAVSLSE